jgi:hypothetical protein
MSTTCGKCGGCMEEGVTTAAGLIFSRLSSEEGSKLVFIVPGTPNSMNPVKAFTQGLAGEPSDRVYPIRGVRCAQCGLLELYAS